MPGFCVKCGAPVTGAFCSACGAAAVSPAQPPATPVQNPSLQNLGWQHVVQPAAQASPSTQTWQPVAQPPSPVQVQNQSWQSIPASPASAAPARKNSGLAKLVFVAGGIVLALFLAGASVAIYGAYWVKHKVSNYASQIGAATGDSTLKVVAKGDTCRLLSTADVQQILGITIERNAEIVESDTPGCAYYTTPDAFKQLQQMALEQQRKRAQEVNSRPGPKSNDLAGVLKNANDLEGVVKAFGLSQPTQDGRVFSFTVQHGFNSDSWSGLRLTESVVPGFEEVEGVGDHAMFGAFGHTFCVVKGDTLMTLDTTFVPDTHTRGAQLARKIMSNL